MNIKKILLEEIGCKKQHTANYDTRCYWCGSEIAEEEPLYFMGDVRKTCDNCFDDIITFLED